MIDIKYALDCDGMSISHVARDSDMEKTVGFYNNEYQLYYIIDGERFFYMHEHCYIMKGSSLTLVDKSKIPFTNIIGGKYHERILVEYREDWLREAQKLYKADFISLFAKRHGVSVFKEDERAAMDAAFNDIARLSVSDDIYKYAKLKNMLIDILLKMLSGCGMSAVEEKESKSSRIKYNYVREVIDYIIVNYDKIISLDDLAKVFFLDKSYLSRIFKEITNFTVSDFINYQKIGHARDKLMDESIPMDAIAAELGYKSLSYFDRVFKKYVGITPTQYRKSKIDKKVKK